MLFSATQTKKVEVRRNEARSYGRSDELVTMALATNAARARTLERNAPLP